MQQFLFYFNNKYTLSFTLVNFSYLSTINTNKTIERVRVFKVLDVPEKHYAIHHETTSPAQLLHFIEHTIPKLLQQSAESFGEKVLFWGTQLKEVKSEE